MTLAAACERFADAVLRREALLMRVGNGAPPRALAGIFVGEDDVDRVLATLPGLDGRRPSEVAEIITATDESVAAARSALRIDMGADRDPPFDLVASLELDAAAVELLAVLLAVEIHTDRQRLVTYLQDDVTRPRCTLGLLDRLLRGVPDALAPIGPGGQLRILGLVETDRDGAWSAKMAWPAEPLSWRVTAGRDVDPLIPPQLPVVRRPAAVESGEHRLVVLAGRDPANRIRAAFGATPADSFVVLGHGDSALDEAVATAAAFGCGVMVHTDDGLPAPVRRIIELTPSLVWAISSPDPLPLGQLPRRPWVDRTLPRMQATADSGATQGLLLTDDQLAAVRAATPAFGGDASAAVRRLVSSRLGRLSTHVRPERRYPDLVLPSEEEAMLRELVARVRHRATVHGSWRVSPQGSHGVVALFSGPSGTGKTLAAEVVAGELGLDMYKVNLSQITSKYIGETEKNLDELFAAASTGQQVLFFDEADALFGKRSDVSDAHDRYANQEVAYLLQALESHDGVAILATNLRGNLDEAFLRRIHVVIEFPEPTEEQRGRIWRLSLPASLPQGEIDIEMLAARFPITGGSIHNVAEHAAFLAAEHGEAVTTVTLLAALEREYRKLGRLLDVVDSVGKGVMTRAG